MCNTSSFSKGTMMAKLSSRNFAAAQGLACHLGIGAANLLQVLKSRYGVNDYYISWREPKDNGGWRLLHNPLEPLRMIQERIKETYLDQLSISDIAHGCVKGRSIVTNADRHIHSHSMLSVDLTDAFGTVSLHQHLVWQPFVTPQIVKDFDRKLKQSEFEVMAQLVDKKNIDGNWRLPQGAITSPGIFNYCCKRLHSQLSNLANNVGGVATCYVDNLFFSMPGPIIDLEIRNAVFRIVRESGFTENAKKTHYARNANRNGVPLRLLGINIIDGDLYLSPKTVERYRGLLYRAGLEADRKTYSWIKGIAIQIYAGWPSRWEEVYFKGLAKGGHI